MVYYMYPCPDYCIYPESMKHYFFLAIYKYQFKIRDALKNKEIWQWETHFLKQQF